GRGRDARGFHLAWVTFLTSVPGAGPPNRKPVAATARKKSPKSLRPVAVLHDIRTAAEADPFGGDVSRSSYLPKGVVRRWRPNASFREPEGRPPRVGSHKGPTTPDHPRPIVPDTTQAIRVGRSPRRLRIPCPVRGVGYGGG